ncbi:response regulator transcription factor [Cellulomonas soli]|uniref:response regulator transcription factor n=1 Tax=Cellulomonas soli TaxID=931535 RepID=UPI003F87F298
MSGATGSGLAAGTPRTLRLVVVDDQPTIRLGMTMILDHEPDLQVVGEAGDGQAAVDVVRALLPDVVLMDVRMPRTDGVEATRRIRADEHCAAVRIVVLTTFDDEEYVEGALRAGADAFLLKDAEPATLVDAVHRVHAGESLLDPKVTRQVVARWRTLVGPGSGAVGVRAGDGGAGSPAGRVDDPAWGSLTPREREVLVEVAGGGSNRAVGAALGLSEATVKAHVHSLLTKLGCENRAQLVVAAYEAGVVVARGRAAGTGLG